MTRGRVVLVLGVAAVVAVLGGWLSAGEDEEDRGGYYEAEDLHEVLGVFEVLTGDLVTPAAALEAATKAQEGKALEIELGVVRTESGPTVAWEVEILGEAALVEVVVDARSGKVIATEKEEDEAEAKALGRLLAGVKAPLGDVLASLEKGVAGRVVLAELELEAGRAVWEAGIVHGGRFGEIAVDAATGKILVGFDDAEDDDREGPDDGGDEDEEDEDD